MASTAITRRISAVRVERMVVLLRGQQVILDRDLAVLYGVTTGQLNQAVTRHRQRFPKDFMLQLTREESRDLISQNVISSWGGTRKPPRAFTEQGVAMLSGILRSARAVQVNVEIMRAFVRLRHLLRQNADLAGKLAALERKYDGHFKVVFDAIRGLMAVPEPRRRRIGFHVRGDEAEVGARAARPG